MRGLRHLPRSRCDPVERGRHGLVALQPPAEDLPVVHSGGVRGFRVEEDEVLLPVGGFDVQTLGHGAPRLEPQAVERPGEGGVIVLDARRLSEDARLHVPNELDPLQRLAGEPGQGSGHRHCQRGGTAQARAERDPGDVLDLDRGVGKNFFHERRDERHPGILPEVGGRVGDGVDPVVRGDEPDALLRRPDVTARAPVDREVDCHRARVKDVERPEVESPSSEIDPRRGGRFDDVGVHGR